MQSIKHILCCPRCRGKLQSDGHVDDERMICANVGCLYASVGFPVVAGQPVLIDFEQSIFSRADFSAGQGASVLQRETGRPSLKSRIKKALFGHNKVARRHLDLMVSAMKRYAKRPRLLVVGGGTIGSGIEALYNDPDVEVVCTDVYVSPHTQFVADGHQLPFVSESFDGVWIQAVLEHVVDPAVVVAEIHRVLKRNGVVYADTPFMQPVHEGAHDFTRFTLTGHRWLFRGFSVLGAGVVSGAGSATIWSIRYLVRSLTGSNKMATGVSLLFFWLRFLDSFARPGFGADAACGVYFFGRKAQMPVSPQSLVRFYADQRNIGYPAVVAGAASDIAVAIDNPHTTGQ